MAKYGKSSESEKKETNQACTRPPSTEEINQYKNETLPKGFGRTNR